MTPTPAPHTLSFYRREFQQQGLNPLQAYAAALCVLKFLPPNIRHPETLRCIGQGVKNWSETELDNAVYTLHQHQTSNVY